MIVKYDCVTCENEDCMDSGSNSVTINCNGYKHKQTNADRIRAMSDEELAEIITDDWCEIVCSGTDYLCRDGTCEQHVLKWLKQEAER